MEMLDKNEIEELVDLDCLLVDCAVKLKCLPLDQCLAKFWCRWILQCGPILKCDGPFFRFLTEDLTACGGEFFVKCPGFDRIARYCEFDPAIDALKWKEQVQLERMAQLEAKVKELEVIVRKKG